MTFSCTSAVTTMAYAAVSSSSPSTAAVRIFSLSNPINSNCQNSPSPINSLKTPTSKILHLVRHAEGTHNISPDDHKTPAHLDAALTPRGVQQCQELAKFTRNLELDAVLVSPMTRCLETAKLSFPHVYGPLDVLNNDANNGNLKSNEAIINKADGSNVPFIAYEEWRETVNYLCDSRRPRTILQNEFPHVDFDKLNHEHDPLWSRYESKFGCYKSHTALRESNDANSLFGRAHAAWKVLLSRPERQLALVGHSAFFMHMFTPLFEELEGVVEYGDEECRALMTKGLFENCELRSIVVDVPR